MIPPRAVHLETLGEIYRRSPHEALDVVLTEGEKHYHGCAFLWTSIKDANGVRYGSYKHVNRKDLEGRTYEIEFLDYQVSLLFTDKLYVR